MDGDLEAPPRPSVPGPAVPSKHRVLGSSPCPGPTSLPSNVRRRPVSPGAGRPSASLSGLPPHQLPDLPGPPAPGPQEACPTEAPRPPRSHPPDQGAPALASTQAQSKVNTNTPPKPPLPSCTRGRRACRQQEQPRGRARAEAPAPRRTHWPPALLPLGTACPLPSLTSWRVGGPPPRTETKVPTKAGQPLPCAWSGRVQRGPGRSL